MAFLLVHALKIDRTHSPLVTSPVKMTLAAPNASQNARPNHNASRTLLYQTLILQTSHGRGNAWAEATSSMSVYHLNTPQVERDTTVGKAVNIIINMTSSIDVKKRFYVFYYFNKKRVFNVFYSWF